MLMCCALITFMASWPVYAGLATSNRSKEVCAKTTPVVESQLAILDFHFGSPIYVRIFKQSSELELWVKKKDKFELFKTYEICAFSGNLGPKQKEGDWQSPEGFYFVRDSQLNPFSKFHLSFNLGYPNKYDRSYGRTGSALMVHGDCVSAGCFAMTDQQVNEIYILAEAALKNGQSYFKVHIFPFRMTEENMEKYKDSEWIGFWRNLKEGYDIFEHHRVPPETLVKNKRYVFNVIRSKYFK